MTFTLALSAIRQHPLSLIFTALLMVIFASVLGAPVPLALAGWVGTGLTSLELWFVLEPFILRRFAGVRDPSHAERQRLQAVSAPGQLQPLIAIAPDVIATRGLRSLIIGRDLLDVMEDRALSGLLAQAAAPVNAADLAGVLLVWLAN